ncbi:helix-turn-helix domain-containing protein [Hafnia alvei]|uniref:helix-turn-helix domain-containing protein n=1 Tax=Hafnia alvei TaxID=569 RepID=UPI00197D2E26|nr:helix-turn-helix domain-containing protein [Hafnia alvei]
MSSFTQHSLNLNSEFREHCNLIFHEISLSAQENVSFMDDGLTFTDNANQSQFYALTSGSISLFNKETGLRSGVITAPNCFGFFANSTYQYNHRLIAESECRYYVLPVNTLHFCLTNARLWGSAANILAANLCKLSEYRSHLNSKTAYESVCFLLMHLYKQPIGFRQKHSVSKFILQRTLLSKSSIMAIIATLRQQKSIVVEHGCLTSIAGLSTKS